MLIKSSEKNNLISFLFGRTKHFLMLPKKDSDESLGISDRKLGVSNGVLEIELEELFLISFIKGWTNE